ncbi:hypothetical protein DMUE_4189 [Dictyocoela muelleri]|nr:hypothetical protein DMUE_4189 [Dictyocoela muelleri]
MFVVVDESEIKKKKYFNVLAGCIDEPKKIYFFDYIFCDLPLNSVIVKHHILKTIEKFQVLKNNLKLIISDSARYMVKGIGFLKEEIPNLFHVQCLAHLIHNRAMKIKAYYKNVEFLVSSIKGITHKNKTNFAKFVNIGQPPSVIITRWSSWLRAVNYYCENLPEVKNIVSKIENDSILVSDAKDSIKDKTLFKSLCEIKEFYISLVEILDNFESSTYDIESEYKVLNDLNIVYDPVQIKEYINNRLKVNDISVIATLKNKKISPACYVAYKKCPHSSIAVEGSFSMPRKLLAKIVIFYLKCQEVYVFIL